MHLHSTSPTRDAMLLPMDAEYNQFEVEAENMGDAIQ